MTGNSPLEKEAKVMYELILNSKTSLLLLISFFIFFPIFVANQPIIESASAQLVLDSFSAKGVIALQLPQDMQSIFQKDFVHMKPDNKTTNAENVSHGYIVGPAEKEAGDNVISEDEEKKKLKSMSDFFKDYRKKYFYDSLDNRDDTNKENIELDRSAGTNQNSIVQDNNVSKKKNESISLDNRTLQHRPAVLQGQWEFNVQKGNPENFKVLLALVKDGKISNVFGIFNLRDTEYIQLNDKGSKIITGKIDFKSAGLRNETINDVDAVISIQGFTQLRVDLDDTKTSHLFTKGPIVGVTKILVDGSGNILIGPPPQQLQPRSIPTPSHSPDKPLDRTKNIF